MSRSQRTAYQIQGTWRLLGAQKTLRNAIERTHKLHDQILSERLKRQIQRLDTRHATLRRDAALLRDVPDIAAHHRLATQIAEFFQDVGRLEQEVDTILEREAVNGKR